jgi:hypothetical protein
VRALGLLLVVAGCVHEQHAVALRDRCAGQVLTLTQPVAYAERDKGVRYDAAELAPAQASGTSTLPPGTRLEIVHCEAFWADPSGPAEDRAWAFAISQDPAVARELLFRSQLARLPDGRFDFLDARGRPVGAQLESGRSLTWTQARFAEIQNSVRVDREGNPAFELGKVVPAPGF